MTVIVVDASAVATAITSMQSDGSRVRARLRGQRIAAPDLMRLEVVSFIRRRIGIGDLERDQADAAVEDLASMPILVFPTAPLMTRVWQLRDNLTPYDACYAALAEALDCPLLTADVRLARSAGPRCKIEVV